MIHRYTCPVCGYDRAVWKLTLSNSTLTYCENCYSLYIRKTAHIDGFNLNRQKRRIHHA